MEVISRNLSKNTQKLLQRELSINKSRIYITDQFIDLDNYKELFNYFNSTFFYKPYKPRFPQRIYDFKGDCFLAIRNKDIIIHHPFDTLAWVINLRLSLNLNIPKGSKIITGSVIKTRSPKKGDVVTYNVGNVSETKIRLI